jgi:hypothetical protein
MSSRSSITARRATVVLLGDQAGLPLLQCGDIAAQRDDLRTTRLDEALGSGEALIVVRGARQAILAEQRDAIVGDADRGQHDPCDSEHPSIEDRIDRVGAFLTQANADRSDAGAFQHDGAGFARLGLRVDQELARTRVSLVLLPEDVYDRMTLVGEGQVSCEAARARRGGIDLAARIEPPSRK